MILTFRQRIFSWFDSYDVFDESGNTVFSVKGQLSWGHCLKIFDRNERELGTVKEKIMTLLPKFEVYLKDQYLGCIRKEFTLFVPKYDIDYNGWHVQGNFLEWDYRIMDASGRLVAVVSKELLHLTDTYSIDVVNPDDALIVLMFVLAMDAEKCSRND